MAEYRQGTGPDRLPQGGASQVNAATPTESDYGELALENTDVPVQYAPGEADAIPNDDSGLADDKQILLEDPDPGYEAQVIPKERKGRIPKYTVRHIAQFRAAATAPDAPPGLRALYNATIRQLDEEHRSGR